MVLRSKLLLSVGAILSLGAIVAACGSSGDSATGSCLPNATQTCLCGSGTMGVQACNSDGKSFSMCQCGAASGAGGSTSSSTSTSSGSGNGTGGSGCSCNPSSELYCGAAACADAGSGDAGTGAGGSCTGVVTFAGKVSASGVTFASNWSYKAAVGIAAGNQACQDQGADHVCDYDDLVLAASKGEITGLAVTDTAWLQRTHAVTPTAATASSLLVLGEPATVGTTYMVSKGSRCADWNYSTDHLNDGEFVSFENGLNKPTFNLDNNPCAIQAALADGGTKYIPCGHNTMPRDVLCCYPKCETVPDTTCTCNASSVCQ